MRHHLRARVTLCRVGDRIAKKPRAVRNSRRFAHIRDPRQETVALDERQIDIRGNPQRLHEGGGAISARPAYAGLPRPRRGLTRRERVRARDHRAEQLHLAGQHQVGTSRQGSSARIKKLSALEGDDRRVEQHLDPRGRHSGIVAGKAVARAVAHIILAGRNELIHGAKGRAASNLLELWRQLERCVRDTACRRRLP